MARTEQVNQWITTVQENLPHLNRPQATVLALWSFSAVVLRCCSLTLATSFLAELEKQKPNTVRQRLREFYQDIQAKRGEKRQEIDVSLCFGPLLRWVLRLWQGPEIALALDATLLSDRFAALVISVVYRGGAIPIAWRIVPANQAGAWKPHWLDLLDRVGGVIPSAMTVLALTDRGLYAKWLYRKIEAIAWHPFMRINRNGLFRPQGSTQWVKLTEIVAPGQHYRKRGTMFKTKDRQLACTLVACWEQGYDEAWFLVTDLAPTACDGAWYGLRSWIEQGFKCIKSSGFQWQHSRLVHADRMERLWLVYSVSTLWMVSIGSEFDAGSLYGTAQELVLLSVPRRRTRRQRVFCLGLLRVLVALLRGVALPLPRRLIPEPWMVPRPMLNEDFYSIAA